MDRLITIVNNLSHVTKSIAINVISKNYQLEQKSQEISQNAQNIFNNTNDIKSLDDKYNVLITSMSDSTNENIQLKIVELENKIMILVTLLTDNGIISNNTDAQNLGLGQSGGATTTDQSGGTTTDTTTDQSGGTTTDTTTDQSDDPPVSTTTVLPPF